MVRRCPLKPILLIADGDVELCDLFQGFLSRQGYDVETASDGLDCLEKLRRVRPAALVLERDLRWGGGDGVLAWLREENTGSRVAVVLTAMAGPRGDVGRGSLPPGVSFLPKPFTPAALLETVRDAVARRGQELGLDACSELCIG
jgi:DNA-binding response OmpR family regulator